MESIVGGIDMRSNYSIYASAALAALLWFPAVVGAGEIVQTGSLTGSGAAATQPVIIDAFDDQGGTLQLTSVHVEALTAIGGGYQTDGSGTVVDVDAFLTANYSLGGILLVSTQALLDLTVTNNGPIIAVSVFDNDTGETLITDPAELAAWTGPGTVTLDAFTEFSIIEIPPGVIFFGAGGTVEYTVTYEFEPAPPGDQFRRGDANADGALDIADAVYLLEQLFSGATPTECPDAADANDDGLMNIADPVFTLSSLFSGGPFPSPPFDSCGVDPTADSLECTGFAACP
jgi:hypothetical protein